MLVHVVGYPVTRGATHQDSREGSPLFVKDYHLRRNILKYPLFFGNYSSSNAGAQSPLAFIVYQTFFFLSREVSYRTSTAFRVVLPYFSSIYYTKPHALIPHLLVLPNIYLLIHSLTLAGHFLLSVVSTTSTRSASSSSFPF